MAGFAGFSGRAGGALDCERAAAALSFTGREVLSRVSSRGFSGAALTHAGEAARLSPIFVGDGVTLMLDGYITAIEGYREVPGGAALAVCASFYREEGPGFARRLNGSFALAIRDDVEDVFHLIADRIGSRNVYYRLSPGLLAFATRLEAIRRVDPSAADRVRESALAEFLSLGRLVDGCLLEGVDLVPAAHALTYDGQTLKVRRYWSPIFSYESDRLDLETNARRLAGAIGEAVRESVCGWGKAGLLLSGGLDSRLVLPFLDGRKTTCYTVCDRRNLETRVAEWAAKRVGAVHVKLWRGASHYIDMVPDASRVCEGSSEYFHAHLEGLWDRFGRDEDRVLLSGYAMNSLLRSYFMPYLGALQGTRTDHNETFRSVQSVRSFEEKILKILVPSGDAQAVVAPGLRQDVRAYTLEAVKRFAARHVDFIASPLDLFELYVFHHIALGRTHPFLESLRQRLPERCPVFDERLVAIALSTPPEQRFDSRVFRQALMLTDPRLALLIDANTCVPAVVGGNAAVRGKKALRFVERVPNAVRKRLPRSGTLWLQKASSWHDLGALWRWSDLWKRLDDLLADEAAMRDELLSADGVRELLRRHLDGKGYHQSIFSRVLSFLEWRRSCP